MEKITYKLQSGLIAQFPLEDRDQCKLLCLDRSDGELTENVFADLPKLLTKDHLLVINDTKVRKARLFGVGSQSGRRCELFLIDKLTEFEWICLARPGKKAKKGARFYFSAREYCEILEILSDGSRRIRFYGSTGEHIMDKYGRVPLPPYIKRDDVAIDRKMYQTVYAREGFSVAAPTAGLHFTDEVLAKLEKKGVSLCQIRLDVGRGTFKPIEAKHYERHRMDPEEFWIDEDAVKAINAAKKKKKKIVAVGTTVVRALEGCYAKHGKLVAGHDDTNVFIFPEFEFKVVDELITNFHLPGSTLLALTAAFSGVENILKAYDFAMEKKYRFFSYGDAMYIK